MHSLSPTYESHDFSGDRRVMEYLDISADECNDELEDHFLEVSYNASSSMFLSLSATSCSSSPSATTNFVSHS